MLNYSETKLWKDSIELYKYSCSIFYSLKESKYFRLSDQVESSCGSISDNIAEGFGRGGNKELIQFLSIARGSCTEFECQITRIEILGLISESTRIEIHRKTKEIQRQINSFISYLNSSKFKGAKFNR